MSKVAAGPAPRVGRTASPTRGAGPARYLVRRVPDRPLRILHLTAASEPGGLSRYLLDLAAACRGLGHDVHVAGDVGPWQHAFDDAGLPYHRVPLAGGLSGFWRSARQLRPIAGGFDVLHAHYRRAVLLGRRLQTSRRPPLLYTLHLSHMPLGGLLGARRLLADWGDHAHCASRDAADWLTSAAGVDRGRVTVIPHGVDLARFTPPTDEQKHAARRRLGVPADAVVATCVGRLESPKNQHWLLDLPWAANRHLLLAGDGPDRAALERAATQNVHFLGETDPPAVYHAADVLLLPSGREGFALVAAEALACGVPVVRTRTSGTAETIVENVTGRSTPIDRPAFAAAAEAALADPAALRAMAGACRGHAERRFDPARQVAETLALYRRLAEAASA